VDTTPPAVTAWAEPRTARVGATVRIVAECTDGHRVADVTVEVWAPTGASLGAFPMAYDAVAGAYVHEAFAGVVGTYAFNVTARDPSGNRASVAGTFTVLPAEGGLLEAVWWILPVAAVAILVLVFWRRRKRNDTPPKPGGAAREE